MSMYNKIDSKKNTTSSIFSPILKEIFLFLGLMIIVFLFASSKLNPEGNLIFINFAKLLFLFAGFAHSCLGFSYLNRFFRKNRDLNNFKKGLLFVVSGVVYELVVIVISNF